MAVDGSVAEGSRSANARQVKGSIAKMTLSYVRRLLGPDAVAAVLAEADGGDATGRLDEPGSWTSREHTLAVAAAAAKACGDPEIGRRVGEELMRVQRERGTVDFVRATGSVVAALEMAADAGTRMSDGRVIRLEDSGPGWATIEAVYLDVAYADPFFCGQAAGYYGLVPDVFGFSGVIAEPECMCRGDARCLYRIAWSEDDAHAVAVTDVDESRERSNSLSTRFEQLHSMAIDMVSAEDVDGLLARVAESAGIAINAPRYLLAVRPDPTAAPRIHHRGFRADRVERVAERLLNGELHEHASCLIADVASARHVYGRLVAMYPKGSSVADAERRLFVAYARHAAAVLEAVASLDAARRDRDTARALFALAQAVAEVGMPDHVATRLAAAVPAVTDCGTASVWLWNGSRAELQLAAVSSCDEVPEEHPLGATLTLDDIDGLHEMVRNPTAVMVSSRDADPGLARVMTVGGIRRCAIAPIAARGSFLGVVVAGFVDDEPAERDPDADGELLTRMSGLADVAATALDNAMLLSDMHDQALHDGLTGLPNRTLIEDRARQALARQARTGGGVAILFVDLDRFKNVNDTLGHEMGDELLRQVGARLGGRMRTSDTVGRLGGDEFVIVLPDTSDPSDATSVATKVLADLSRPFVLGGRDAFISASIGIALAPDHGTSYEALLGHADAAMYQAKEAGRNGYAVHAVEVGNERRRRLSLESDLRNAIRDDQLRVLYQPQVDLRTTTVVGVEALVRWDHPERGRLGPDVFVPLAEESGLIVDVDRWVRERAFAQARSWLDAGVDVQLAMNLSTRGLHDPDLLDHAARLLRRYDLAPERVELEITDRIDADEATLCRLLGPLRDLGVRLAIDDFGTGTSVIGRLQGSGFDTLKIDRSFVAPITSPRSRAPVVTALLAMARGLGLRVVAEGVETEAQLEFMRRHDCELVQGFYFSRPVEAEDIVHLVRCGSRLGASARGGATVGTTSSSNPSSAHSLMISAAD